jgi:hypothetical protein
MTIRHWLSSALYFHHPLPSSARLRRPLSAITKKPAALAGFRYLSCYPNSTHNAFSSAYPLPLTTSLFSLGYSNSKCP